MSPSFSIFYHESVVRKDIPKLPKTWHINIQRAIESRLMTKPDLYGKPLRRSLKGYRKLRVGDYRVVFRIDDHTVKILIIEHRSAVYEEVSDRI